MQAKGIHLAVLSVLVIALPFPILAGTASDPVTESADGPHFPTFRAKRNTRLLRQPAGSQGQKVKPLTRFFLTDKKTLNDRDWLKVRNTNAGLEGWLDERDLVKWNHAQIISLRNPGSSDRVLFFREVDQLSRFVNSIAETSALYRSMYRYAEEGRLLDKGPVAAIQPRHHKEIGKQFYLLPIVDHRDVAIDSQHAKLLRITSVVVNGNEYAPNLDQTWLMDRFWKNPDRRILDVHVLLTRDQLSELHLKLREVLEAAGKGVLSPEDFLRDLKSLSATASRFPEKLARSTIAGGEKKAVVKQRLKDYSKGLPYGSEIMNLTEKEWRGMGPKSQLGLVSKLERKLQYYRVLHDDSAKWVSLNGGVVNGDSLYPVALDMLP